jgi:hypothetical protein
MPRTMGMPLFVTADAALVYFQEHRGIRLLTTAALMPLKSFEAATSEPDPSTISAAETCPRVSLAEDNNFDDARPSTLFLAIPPLGEGRSPCMPANCIARADRSARDH